MPTAKTPSATYRVQFHRNFRFVDARDLVPYLRELGISDLYASPRFRARRGSSHGYDVVDPQRVNSELGTEREFEELVARLKDYRMGLLLDIVPNHMAASAENPWWTDVLEHGRTSPYADYFDIHWDWPERAAPGPGRILLPVLGDFYGRVLERQEITLALDENGFAARYAESRFPLDPKTTRPILEACLERMREAAPENHTTGSLLTGLIEEIERLPSRHSTDPEAAGTRRGTWEAVRKRLWQLFVEHVEFRHATEQTLREWNGAAGDPESFNRLDRLLEEQVFRLAYWRAAPEAINYRRFFDVNDLAGLRVERPEVFAARHTTILELVEGDRVSGLRVDHVDGLYDPHGYLERLSRECTERSARHGLAAPYLIVEKILGANEPLPEDWPVDGTTGYDFLNAVNEMQIEARGAERIEATYAQFTGETAPFAEAAFRGNLAAIDNLFRGELRRLAFQLAGLASRDRYARDVPFPSLLSALAELTACLPVYRTYVAGNELTASDRRSLDGAFGAAFARRHDDPFHGPALDFLRRLITLEPSAAAEADRSERLSFVMQWQQFSGPVMAKGLEDTAFYIHNSLISLNEVGGDPARKGPPRDVAAFHRFQQERIARCPVTMNTTSTHDTKRSEDVRARINVLSEIPGEWHRCVFRWHRWNRPKKTWVGEHKAPTRSEEMFLYETLLGGWPFDEGERDEFRERMSFCLIKAAREAKLHTNWTDPRPEHEEAITRFLNRILEPGDGNNFLRDFSVFQARLAFHGALNSLSALLVKIASPGVPDFYQGMELWDFSLMDPDNRRPVDFSLRARVLGEMTAAEHADREKLVEQLLVHWRDGRIKLYVTKKCLDFRVQKRDLFIEGDYQPLPASGKAAGNVCAFARRKGERWVLAAAPLFTTQIVEPERMPIGRDVWGMTALALPREAPREWRDIFTGETIESRATSGRKRLTLESVFRRFPVALLESVSS
jgi:(1->4)-alpha-D-glucan 1-alpha-D-glucosylmutase